MRKKQQSMQNGNLNEKLGSVQVIGLSLYTLKVGLPCQRWLVTGKSCGKETTYALVVEKGDYNIVIPMCAKHLPDWAQDILKERRKGA